MNRLSGLNQLLNTWDQGSEIHVDADLGKKAMEPLTRMLDFKATLSA